MFDTLSHRGESLKPATLIICWPQVMLRTQDYQRRTFGRFYLECRTV